MESKIVICAVWAGGGHIAAMQCLSSILKADDKNQFRIETFTSQEKGLGEFHDLMYSKLPWVYALGYRLTHSVLGSRIEPWSTRKVVKRFEQELEHYFLDPEVAAIISTHFLMTRAALHLKAKYPSSPIRVIGYVPDFDHSPVHFKPTRGLQPDGLIARSPDLLKELGSQRRFEPSFLVEAGYLPAHQFKQARALPTEAALQSVKMSGLSLLGRNQCEGLNPSVFTVVIAGGSGWSGRLRGKVTRLLKSRKLQGTPTQFLVVTGGNPDAIQKYRKLEQRFPEASFFILPKLNHEHLSRVYRAADLIWLAGLAPATLFELIEAEARPIVLSYVNPGQEEANVRYAQDRGLIRFAPKTTQAIREIEQAAREFLSTRRNKNQKTDPQFDRVRDEMSQNNSQIVEFVQRLLSHQKTKRLAARTSAKETSNHFPA